MPCLGLEIFGPTPWLNMRALKRWALAWVCVWAGYVGAQTDEARAQKIVAGVCFLCHGMEGESSSEVFPRLAGQHWEYIAKQLENFKTGKRKSTAMADMVVKLRPDEMIGQYASYIESQLKSFGKRERTNDNAVMHSIVAKMTPLEIAAVAEYLSGK